MRQDFSSVIRRSGTPVTFGLIGSILASFVFAWFGVREIATLAYDGSLNRAWAMLTYPWASQGQGGGLFFLLLALLWLYFMGSAVEREVGSGRFFAIFMCATVLGGLGILVGTALGVGEAVLLGALVPVSAITVAWAARNPEATIMLYGLIPLRAKWIGILTVVLLVFGFGTGQPAMGLFAALPCLVAFLYARNQIPGLAYATAGGMPRPSAAERRREQQRHQAYLDEIRAREKEREERQRLKELFERSLIEDPDERR